MPFRLNQPVMPVAANPTVSDQPAGSRGYATHMSREMQPTSGGKQILQIGVGSPGTAVASSTKGKDPVASSKKGKDPVASSKNAKDAMEDEDVVEDEDAVKDEEYVPPIFDGMDLSSDNIERMKKSYRKHGVIRIKVTDDDFCREFIIEMWNDIIMKQPWIHKIRLFSSDDPERELHLTNPADEEEYLQIITSRLDPKVRKMMEKAWPLHRGFGACCDPGVFFSKCAMALRENRYLYNICKHLLGYKRLWSDVNRQIQKLPGQGMAEFFHWDFNPLARTVSYPNGISGKFCATKGYFYCVLCTHTDEFFKKFVPLYKPLYPGAKENDSKFALSENVSDPLGLYDRIVKIPVPAGVIILWDNKLLHKHAKSAIHEPMSMGQYVGYFAAGSRPMYEEKCGVDEREDRVQAYRNGTSPKLWPSFDKIQFYPKRFDSAPGAMKAYLDKLPAGHAMRGSRVTDGGKVVHFLATPVLVDYKPLPMTKLGKQLLGLLDWPVSKRARVEDHEGDFEGGAGCSSGQKRARVGELSATFSDHEGGVEGGGGCSSGQKRARGGEGSSAGQKRARDSKGGKGSEGGQGGKGV
jgi:hypothetical protein